MHDVSDAEKIYAGLLRLIGYVKEIAPGVWLPININKETISGPSSKDDAITIVRLNDTAPINPTE